jgi:hypothetical protein
MNLLKIYLQYGTVIIFYQGLHIFVQSRGLFSQIIPYYIFM